jgi:hypothetical protein
MKKNLLLITIFLISTTINSTFAQKDPVTPYDKVKFGGISVQDFDVKPTGQDSAASAIMLFKIGSIDFAISNKGRWNYTYEIFKRIKVLNKEGYKYGDFQIPIYKNSNNEEVLRKVQIASYNLIDGKVVQNKAAKDEKFLDKFNENYTINKYTLSNIQEGTIIEIKYEIQSDFIYTLKDWYFQEEIPIIWSDFTFIKPAYFNYKINFKNPINVKLINDTENLVTFSGSVAGEGVSGRQEQYNFNVNAQKKRWVAENVKAFKDEPYITTEDDFISKIDFEIVSTNFEGEGYKSYSQTWEKVFEGYKQAEKFGLFAKPNNYSKKLVASIVNENDSIPQKIVKIFNFVKTSIKWNGKNGDYASQNSIKDVIESKTGNIGDINLTLLSLLNSANINADPVLLSTRDNGAHPGIPSSVKFNYVIVAAAIDSNSVLLDASNVYHNLNMISSNALNHLGKQVNLESLKSEWINIDPKNNSLVSLTSIVTLDNDLKVKGNFNYRKTEYYALNARRYFNKFTSEADYLKDFKEGKNGLTINKYTQTGAKNLDELYSENFEFELQDYVEEAGNLVYFNPLFFEQTKQNPFKQETRSFPVDFAYPTMENIRIIINVPEGFTIDKIPESISYKMEDGSMSFLYTTTKLGNQILVTSKINVLKSTFEPQNYEFIKDLFKQIVTKQAQPIVLKKL